MIRPHDNERLLRQRIPGFPGKVEKAAHPSLSHEQVEHMYAARQQMLSSVRADIGASLYGALEAKLRYEQAALMDIIRAEADARTEKKRLNDILNAQYFIKKTLDMNLFQ